MQAIRPAAALDLNLSAVDAGPQAASAIISTGNLFLNVLVDETDGSGTAGGSDRPGRKEAWLSSLQPLNPLSAAALLAAGELPGSVRRPLSTMKDDVRSGPPGVGRNSRSLRDVISAVCAAARGAYEEHHEAGNQGGGLGGLPGASSSGFVGRSWVLPHSRSSSASLGPIQSRLCTMLGLQSSFIPETSLGLLAAQFMAENVHIEEAEGEGEGEGEYGRGTWEDSARAPPAAPSAALLPRTFQQQTSPVWEKREPAGCQAAATPPPASRGGTNSLLQCPGRETGTPDDISFRNHQHRFQTFGNGDNMIGRAANDYRWQLTDGTGWQDLEPFGNVHPQQRLLEGMGQRSGQREQHLFRNNCGPGYSFPDDVIGGQGQYLLAAPTGTGFDAENDELPEFDLTSDYDLPEFHLIDQGHPADGAAHSHFFKTDFPANHIPVGDYGAGYHHHTTHPWMRHPTTAREASDGFRLHHAFPVAGGGWASEGGGGTSRGDQHRRADHRDLMDLDFNMDLNLDLDLDAPNLDVYNTTGMPRWQQLPGGAVVDSRGRASTAAGPMCHELPVLGGRSEAVNIHPMMGGRSSAGWPNNVFLPQRIVDPAGQQAPFPIRRPLSATIWQPPQVPQQRQHQTPVPPLGLPGSLGRFVSGGVRGGIGGGGGGGWQKPPRGGRRGGRGVTSGQVRKAVNRRR